MSETQNPRRTGCCLGTAIVIAVGVCGAVWFVVSCIQNAANMASDCYSLEAVVQMVIEHMDANEGQWPTGWNDLQDDYADLYPSVTNAWSFEELQRRVDVDWTADPKALAKVIASADEPPFKVIWLRNGKKYFWSGGEPNRLILEYLQKGKSKID